MSRCHTPLFVLRTVPLVSVCRWVCVEGGRGFSVDLEPDLCICCVTAVMASLLKGRGFVGCQTFKYNHCSPVTTESRDHQRLKEKLPKGASH